MRPPGRAWLLLTALLKVGVPGTEASDPPAPSPGCTLVQEGGRWHLVGPGGQRFFSRGVCVVTPGTPRDAYSTTNPAYAAWQHYPDDAAWAEATLRRLGRWGFTTVGGWSAFPALQASREQRLWLAPVLHLGSTAGAPWWDMWAATNLARMESLAEERIRPLASDPHRLGYYTDNEIGWWNAALWRMTLAQPATSGQRQRLLEMLEQSYSGRWDALLADFDPGQVAGWEQLREGGMLYVRPGSRGIPVLRRFQALVAARYYQLMHDLVRRHDPNALIMGDRYQSFYYPEVAAAAGPWVDAISSNLNASWNDGTWLRCYLATLHELTGRPIMIGEYYMAAERNRTGNANNRGHFPIVRTQRDRARAVRTTLAQLAGCPYVVGADWFQFFDEPPHGREDGENYNFGLVDVHDRPYAELTGVFAGFDPAPLRRGPVSVRRDATQGIPRAPKAPLANFRSHDALLSWDRERGYVPPASRAPLADLYACWSADRLYLGVYALDPVEPEVYRDGVVPEVDRAQWTLEIAGKPPVRVRLGAGLPLRVKEPGFQVEAFSGVNLGVRNVATLGIPVAWLGCERLRPGVSIPLRCTYESHGRTWQVEWKAVLKTR